MSLQSVKAWPYPKKTKLKNTHFCALVHAVSNWKPVLLFRRNNVPAIHSNTNSCNPGVIFSQLVGVVESETWAVFLAWLKMIFTIIRSLIDVYIHTFIFQRIYGVIGYLFCAELTRGPFIICSGANGICWLAPVVIMTNSSLPILNN